MSLHHAKHSRPNDMPSFIYHSIFKKPDVPLVLERTTEHEKGNVNQPEERTSTFISNH
jgi:hypothetical protein